ncbi:MAG: four helix bundle protein [Candidatus Taylorbacteria bacterium]|nr:four helix bundle protein [Candidatus Taylorbacteria bacterium]
MTPPDSTLPIIHAIRILHKDLYCIAGKLSKRDKLGLHARVETSCIEILGLAVEAAFKPKTQKIGSLESLRIKVEILKHLIRTEHELEIIDVKTYLRLSEKLVKISKMTNGWINFVTQKGAV